MLAVVDQILPIFALIAAGYGATRTPVFNAAAAKALANFVFFFAVPVMLFRHMAGSEPPGGGAPVLMLGYYSGTALVFALGFLIARRPMGRSFGEAAIFGFGSAFSNTVLIGIPVVLTVAGPDASLPLFLIISLHTILFFSVTIVLMEIGAGSGETWRGLGRRVLASLATNPIVLGLAAGLAVNATGVSLPGPIDRFCELLGQAAVPCALFAAGAGLSEFAIRGSLRPASIVLALKMVVHPLVIWGICGGLLALPPTWTLVAVLLAAMPVGVNPYIFATRYGVAEAEMATAVALSTPVSALTITAVLFALA